MRPTAWRYACGNCGSIYELPGADLGHLYGTYFGVSRTGHAVAFESMADSFFDEIQALVDASTAVAGLTDEERVELLHGVLEIALDPAPDGEPHVTDGSPGCPACGSRSVASFFDTETFLDEELAPATHARWDLLCEAARRRLIVEVIARRTDGT